MASCVTDGHGQAPAQVSDLLLQIEQEMESFIADGIYDQTPVYAAVEAHSPGAQVIILPRRNAVMSPTAATSPTQRDEHMASMTNDGLFAWQRTSCYYGQSHAENAFARYKRTFGRGLHVKRDESQEREAAIDCELLNRMMELGRPQSCPVS